MKVYVVVEMFLGGKVPKVRGVYIDRTKAEEAKASYRFSFIDEQNLIQMLNEKIQKGVYVVIELLEFNVPSVIGVCKNLELAKDMSPDRGYEVQIIAEQLIT